MDQKIEKLNNNHIEILVKFKLDSQKEVWKNLGRVLSDDELCPLEENERKFLESHLNKDLVVYGLFVDNKLVAVCGRQTFECSPDIAFINGLMGYICNVYTVPEYRRQGLQDQLQSLCLKELEADQISISLLVSTNPSAINLYQKYGFQPNPIVLTKVS